MLLNEFLNKHEDESYPSNNDDQSVYKLSDLRKTRLTLAQLNKLRNIRDVKKIEHEQKIKDIRQQYRPAPQAM